MSLFTWTAAASAQPNPPQGTWDLCGASGIISHSGATSDRSFRIQLDLPRIDPTLTTMLEGTLTAESRAEGVVRNVLEPGCRGAGCPAGRVTWTASIARMNPAVIGAIEGHGTLTYHGTFRSCTGSWVVGTPEAGDLDLWMFIEDSAPDPSWWGKEEGDPGQGHYGYPARLWVKVREKRRMMGPNFADPAARGAEVRLRFDGREVGLAEADGSGVATFEFTLPEDIPQGLSTHTLQVSAVRGAVRGSFETAWLVQRGLQGITIGVDPIEGVRPVGSTVTISGRVYAVVSGLFLDPVRAKIVTSSEGRGEGTTDDRGYFSLPVKLQDEWYGGHERGTCLWVTAKPVEVDRYEEGVACASIRTTDRGQLDVTLLSDKSLYQIAPPGDPFADTIVLSGQVNANLQDEYNRTWAREPTAAMVVLTIDGRELASVVADATGAYRYDFAPGSVIPNDHPGALHWVDAVAHSEGLKPSRAERVLLTAGDPNASCAPGEVTVREASGISWVKQGGSFGAVHDGTKFTQGGQVETQTSMVTLAFPLGDGAGVRIVVGADTKLKIQRYCQDGSGKVQIRLFVDKPGNIIIDRRSAGATPNYELEVVTPTVAISDLKTRYFVHVDEDGTTTVAVLDGSVSVARPEGGAGIEVLAGEQITVHAGETPEQSPVLALQGQVDPRLIEALEAAGGTLAGGTPGAPDGAAGLAELREIERAVMIDGRWVLVRTETGAFVITVEQLEDYATLAVETGAIRPEERANLVQRLVRESREAFQALIRPEIEALEARTGR